VGQTCRTFTPRRSWRRGQGRNRTGDTSVFSRVLCRLSYLAGGSRPRYQRVLDGLESDCHRSAFLTRAGGAPAGQQPANLQPSGERPQVPGRSPAARHLCRALRMLNLAAPFAFLAEPLLAGGAIHAGKEGAALVGAGLRVLRPPGVRGRWRACGTTGREPLGCRASYHPRIGRG
jgi:hypothetical protein